MKLLTITLVLLLATSVQAQEKKQTAQEGCQQLLQAYSQIQVVAAQAELVSNIQKGIVQVCRELVTVENKAKEDPVVTPTPEAGK